MMTADQIFTPLPNYGADRAITLALRLAHAENALHALTSGQIDAIVDTGGETYLLRPAQEQLRQSESWLKALVGGIADVITVVNRGGTILFQSMAVTRVLGYGPEDLLGKGIFEFIHLEDRAHVYSAFFNVIEGMAENDTILFRHLMGDGSFRTVEATVGKLSEPASTSVVLSLRPVAGCVPERAEPDWQPGASDPYKVTTNGNALQKDGVME